MVEISFVQTNMDDEKYFLIEYEGKLINWLFFTTSLIDSFATTYSVIVHNEYVLSFSYVDACTILCDYNHNPRFDNKFGLP